MEKALQSYSIESPTIVQLLMQDGTTHRVAPDDLPKYLEGDDLDRVKNAFKLRSKYFKSLPKWTAVFGFTAVAALLVMGGTNQFAHQRPVSQRAQQTYSMPMAEATSIDVQQTGAAAEQSANPQPADGFVATTAAQVSKQAGATAAVKFPAQAAVPAPMSGSPLDPQSDNSSGSHSLKETVQVVPSLINGLLEDAHGGHGQD